MKFSQQIFDVFSRRKSRDERPKSITGAFRNRVFLLCRDTFGSDSFGSNLQEFWQQIHKKFQYLKGSAVLSQHGRASHEGEDLLHFLHECSSDHFLDFVEYIFRVQCFWRFSEHAAHMVDSINHFFDVDDLPYSLTDYVQVQEQEPGTTSRYIIRVTAYPQVILRQHALVHRDLIEPALKLLTDPGFAAANAEFLKALEDYRKGDLNDCVAKCGSSFESVLKIICNKKGWLYQQTDTAAPLLNNVLPRTALDSFFQQPLILVATMRNRLSSAHGAGVTPRTVSPQVARFALNATAAAILLVVEETR